MSAWRISQYAISMVLAMLLLTRCGIPATAPTTVPPTATQALVALPPGLPEGCPPGCPGVDLSGAELYGVDLRRANLGRANLTGADLRWANLREVDLSGANLSGANLRKADLHGADLHGADLSRANLVGANLNRADLREAKLHEADLSLAILDGANLRDADLSEASLTGVDLSDADLHGAVLPPTVTPEIERDCAWMDTAYVWLDENANSVWDKDEAPLPNVVVHIDDVLNDFRDVGDRTASDESGEAPLYVWLPGCPKTEFEVYPEVPPGYRLTTATRIRVPGSAAAVQFGFVPLVPTVTPTPTPSATPTPTPTLTPTPSATPSPPPTLTPTPRPAATEEPGPGEPPVYPPFIAYTQIADTGPEILILDTSADPPRVFSLTETPGLALRPRWSPDVQFIAYLYQEPGAEHFDLWLIDNAGGAQSRPLTTGGIEGLEDFDWSAESRFLVFHVIDRERGDRDIYRLDVESGATVNLTADYPFWDSDPAWSPDGEWIAFVSDRADGGKETDHIWLMAADGSRLQKLTGTEWEDVRPAWSPDGAEIAFYRWSFLPANEGGPPGLWVTRADGSSARLVVELSVLGAGLDAPAWSPDGKWIAYQSGPPGEADLYVIPAAGGDPVNVSDLPGHEYSASWSPDSSSLVFTSETEADVRLYVAAPDGADTRPLLEEGGNGFGEWAPAFPVGE